MIDRKILDGLKRVNVSADKEKTKERVEQLWKSAPRATKHQILTDANTKVSSVYRVFREGSIMPRLTVTMAEALLVDPFYLSGEADDDAGWNDASLAHFLQAKGYGKLIEEAETKPKRKYTRRKQAAPDDEAITPDAADEENPIAEADEVEPDEADDIEADEDESDEVFDVYAAADEAFEDLAEAVEELVEELEELEETELSEDDMVLLLRALRIRASYNEEAWDRLNAIVDLLLKS